MATVVVHPVFPDQKYTVDDDRVDDWTKQGWRVDEDADTEPVLSSAEDYLRRQEQAPAGEPVLEERAASVGFMPNTPPADEED